MSRTKHLLDEFAASLQNADKVAVAEIVRAREPQDLPAEVTAADVLARVAAGGVEVVPEYDLGDISGRLARELAPGDVLITLGAGDIRKVCDRVVDGFRTDRAAG